MPADAKSCGHAMESQFSKEDIENQDPGTSDAARKASVQSCKSRLPVLAKSLRLHVPADFLQSHCKWEEKPLVREAKLKNQCTRPAPFNLSKPKSTRVTTVHQESIDSTQSRTRTILPKAKNVYRKSLYSTVANCNATSTKEQHQSHKKAATSPPQQIGQPVISKPFSSASMLLNPPSSVANNDVHECRTATSALSGGVSTSSALLDPPTAKETTKRCDKTQNVQTAHDKEEMFQPAPEALVSILLNEGVSSSVLSKTNYNYQPMRVSVMKSRQKVELTTGPPLSLQFSPDPAALQSILQNEGLKPAGALHATPKNSVRLLGRGTSVYSAQRVPVKKVTAEMAGGVASKQTPLKKWSPQRVPNSRQNTMSSMKWTPSAHRLPCVGTPMLRKCDTDLKLHKEEVVQRLFDEQEDEENTNLTAENAVTQAKQLTNSASTTELPCDDKINISQLKDKSGAEKENLVPEKGIPEEKALSQSLQRESVIFFSTGKRLMRIPRFQTQQSVVPEGHHDKVQSSQEERLLVSDQNLQTDASIRCLHRDHFVQQPSAVSSAAAPVRKCLPVVEEMRLDEEVATYMSVSVSATREFSPTQPRCPNPLASTLHFEESIRFVPIDIDSSSTPMAPCNSSLRDR